MTQVSPIQPVRTIREIMGLESQPDEQPEVKADLSFPPITKAPPPAGLLKSLPSVTMDQARTLVNDEPSSLKSAPAVAPVESANIDVRSFGSPVSRFLAKDYVRYPMLFLVALGFFYFIFNFQAISLQLSGMFSRGAKSTGNVAAASTAEPPSDYNAWIQKYIVFTNDKSVLAPSADPDQDGLTNIEEYYLGTNPFKSDTDGTGQSDGQKVLNGEDPLYPGRRLTVDEQQIVSQHVALTDLQSRLNLSQYQRVAGAEIPGPQTNFTVDISRPGRIVIPRIGVDAQVAWTQDFSKMENDLKNGTAHHPATPYPGQRGTASIHGHSSGNPGDGNFKTVFTKLNFLQPGDEAFVSEYGTDGQARTYTFVARYGKIYAVNDPAQFADLGGYFLNLSTSWPIGTAHERYVVTTELVGVINGPYTGN